MPGTAKRVTEEQKRRGDGETGRRGDGESKSDLVSFPLSQSSTPPSSYSWLDVAALALGLIVLTLGLGDYGFYEPHEGHFAGVAREMLLRGDWITPTLNGAPYLNKPPLLYWLIASSTALLGFTEYAARLPLAIAGWLGAVVAWKWAGELWHPRAGRIAAVMLCVTTGWFLFTHQILIDVLLSTLLLATYYCLWRLVWEPQRWRYCFTLYLLLGLCLLAKGPYVLIFFIISCAGLALWRQSWAVFQQVRIGLGACIALAVVLPWFIAVEKANPGFWQYFLFNENLKRIADTRWPPDYDVSKVSVWGYVAVTAIWCSPWTLLLPQAVTAAWRDWWRGMGEGAREHQQRSEGVLLLGIAAVVPILLFLPLSSRLIYYSLPSIPPFTMLCAAWWWRCHERSQQRGRQIAGIIFGFLGLSIASAAFWAPDLVVQLPELSNASGMEAAIAPTALIVGLAWLCGGVWLLVNRPNLALISLSIGLISAYVTVTDGFVAVQDFRSSKTLIETANPRLSLATLWTFEGSRELGAAGAMSYYLDRDGTQGDTGAQEQSRAGHEEKFSSHSPLLTPHSSLLSPSPTTPGWAKGKPGTVYRVVMVLTDSGSQRLPPAFPGSRPGYAITKKELQGYWDSARPVVFVTDFMRKPGDPLDPLERNLPRDAGESLLMVGSRKLYGNAAARKLWSARSE